MLNIKDIEDVGFEQSYDEPDEWFHAFKGNHDIQLYFDDKQTINNNRIGISIYTEYGLVFNGYILDKNELEQLLKMLHIE